MGYTVGMVVWSYVFMDPLGSVGCGSECHSNETRDESNAIYQRRLRQGFARVNIVHAP